MSTRTTHRRIRFPVRESVAAPQRMDVRETPTIVEAPASGKPGRLLVQLIQAGWSLNGRYYSAEVLRRDGGRAFPAGTLNFIDHATDDEDYDRPSGSLTKLASVQTEAAYYDPKRKALLAEVRVFAPWREAVTDWANSGAIGMSIRAWCEGEHGTVDGKAGWIVSALAEGRSVDYVTKPAAGGAIVSVLESIGGNKTALAEARNIGVWLESRLHLALTQLGDEMYGDGRLTREERIALSSAIGDALKAWTTRVEADAPQLFARDLWDEPGQTEQPADESKTPTAEAVAEDVTDGTPPTSPTNPPAKESSVSGNQNTGPEPGAAGTAEATPAPVRTGTVLGEEARLAGLLAENRTVAAEATARADKAEKQAQEAERRAVLAEAKSEAKDKVREALELSPLTPSSYGVVVGNVIESLELDDKGKVDEAKLKTAIEAEITAERTRVAKLMDEHGVGNVRGLGSTGSTDEVSAVDFDKQMEAFFTEAVGLDEKTAKIAAQGRN